MARLLHVLTYNYVRDILERRAPHRDDHLAHVAAWHDEGRILLAGALGEPPSGALFVFALEDPVEVARFVVEDPYVRAGLVTAQRIEPWREVAEAGA